MSLAGFFLPTPLAFAIEEERRASQSVDELIRPTLAGICQDALAAFKAPFAPLRLNPKFSLRSDKPMASRFPLGQLNEQEHRFFYLNTKRTIRKGGVLGEVQAARAQYRWQRFRQDVFARDEADPSKEGYVTLFPSLESSIKGILAEQPRLETEDVLKEVLEVVRSLPKKGRDESIRQLCWVLWKEIAGDFTSLRDQNALLQFLVEIDTILTPSMPIWERFTYRAIIWILNEIFPAFRPTQFDPHNWFFSIKTVLLTEHSVAEGALEGESTKLSRLILQYTLLRSLDLARPVRAWDQVLERVGTSGPFNEGFDNFSRFLEISVLELAFPLKTTPSIRFYNRRFLLFLLKDYFLESSDMKTFNRGPYIARLGRLLAEHLSEELISELEGRKLQKLLEKHETIRLWFLEQIENLGS